MSGRMHAICRTSRFSLRNKTAPAPVLQIVQTAWLISTAPICHLNPTIETENHMKLVITSLFAVTLSAASLSAGAATMRTDLLGEPAQPASAERRIVTALAGRTIDITGGTK